MADSAGSNAFQQALGALDSYGTPQVVAAFQVGWEVQHLRNWKLSQEENRDWAARKVLRIESALKDLEATVPDSSSGVSASAASTASTGDDDDPFAAADYPTTDALRVEVRQLPEVKEGTGATTDPEAALKGFRSSLDVFGARFWRAVLVARECAALPPSGDGSQQPPAAVATAVADAYQLGLSLASIALAGAGAKSKHDLKAAVSRPDSKDAAEAYGLASRLRGSFPAGAAYAVARHIEDWSDWVNGLPLDWTVPPPSTRKVPTEPLVDLEECRKAMFRQGKVWESLLTGQSLGKDYLVSSSWADAADHILVEWGLSTASLVRTLRRTTLGKLVLGLMGVAVVVVLFALIYQFGLTPSARSNSTTGPTTATILTVLVGVLGSAAGLVHYVRSHIAAATAKIWDMTEPALVTSEVLEAIAIATRRLPAEGMCGGAGGGEHRTFDDRRKRAKSAALATPASKPMQRLTESQGRE